MRRLRLAIVQFQFGYHRHENEVLNLAVCVKILLAVEYVDKHIIHQIGHRCGIVAQYYILQVGEFFAHLIVVAPEDVDVVVRAFACEHAPDVGEECVLFVSEVYLHLIYVAVKEAHYRRIDVGMMTVERFQQVGADVWELVCKEIVV